MVAIGSIRQSTQDVALEHKENIRQFVKRRGDNVARSIENLRAADCCSQTRQPAFQFEQVELCRRADWAGDAANLAAGREPPGGKG
jgi:hypothetical protein